RPGGAARAHGEVGRLGSVEVPGAGRRVVGGIAVRRSRSCATAGVGFAEWVGRKDFRRPQVGYVDLSGIAGSDGGEPVGAALGDRVNPIRLGRASGNDPSAA